MAEILGAVTRKSGEKRDEKLAELVEKAGKCSQKSHLLTSRERAFEEIVGLCEKGVYDLAFQISRNREDAMDISQDTFVKLWQLLEGDTSPLEIKSWYSYILRMTRNCALDFLRKQSIRRHDSLMVADEDGELKEMDIPADDISSDPVRSFERNEQIEAVREAIASLDEDYRQILILRENEGCSYKEIGDIMGIEMGTVKSKIFRARNLVKEYLEKRNIF